MGCERFANERLLAAYGEQGPDAEWESHVATCAGCTDAVAETREIHRIYAAGSTGELPERARARIADQVRPGRRVRRFTPAMAAMLLFALFLPVLMTRLVSTGVPPKRTETEEVLPTSKDVQAGIQDVRDRVRIIDVVHIPGPPSRDIDDELDDVRRRLNGFKMDAKNF